MLHCLYQMKRLNLLVDQFYNKPNWLNLYFRTRMSSSSMIPGRATTVRYNIMSQINSSFSYDALFCNRFPPFSFSSNAFPRLFLLVVYSPFSFPFPPFYLQSITLNILAFSPHSLPFPSVQDLTSQAYSLSLNRSKGGHCITSRYLRGSTICRD